MRHALDGFARQGGVGGDHTVHAVLAQRGGDHTHLGFVQIGGDFQEHGHASAVFGGQGLAPRHQRAEQAVQRFVALQRTQVFGVGAGDVHRHVVGVWVHTGQGDEVIVGGVLDRCGGVFADVQAQQHGVAARGLSAPRALHIGHEGVQALVVEAQAVDQGVGLRQAEHARLGVARLRFGRDRADLHKTKTHGAQAVDTTRVFVQTGG